MSWFFDWILPPAVAVGVALALPAWLAGRLPRTGRGLILNLAISSLVLWALGAAYFAAAYAVQDPRIVAMIAADLPGLWHFARLGLLAGLLWAPLVLLMLLSRWLHWQNEA